MKVTFESSNQTFGIGKGRKRQGKRYKNSNQKKKRNIRYNQKFWKIPKNIVLQQEHSSCSTCVLSFSPLFKPLFALQNTDSADFLLLSNFVFSIVRKVIETCAKTKELDLLESFLSSYPI